MAWVVLIVAGVLEVGWASVLPSTARRAFPCLQIVALVSLKAASGQ